MKLLTPGYASAKIRKSDEAGLGYMTAIMYLAPHFTSGNNVCPNASPGCSAACLFTAGRGRFYNVQEARVKRTNLYYMDRKWFREQLETEIEAFVKKVSKEKLHPAIRLNGTSDIGWETVFPGLMDKFDMVQFYDYTKSTKRMLKWLNGELPENYHLTYSRSELNEKDSLEILRNGGNVAVVFSTKELPNKWQRFTVFNADKHDLRFLDPRGVAGLSAKGKAKKDETGFVVR